MQSTGTEQPLQCAQDGCTRNARQETLYRTNPQGVPGVFMCKPHARRSRHTDAPAVVPLDLARIRAGR
jgi:hypothetical protein